MSSILSKLINLAGNLTGTLPVANGGTGITSGTDGGVLGYTASGTLASSAALAANGVVIGGGAGATPTAITAGTNGQLLVGVTSGAPAFGNTVSALTTFNSGVVVSNAASQSTLSNFQIGSQATTFTFSGGGTSSSITMRYQRIGDWVMLFFPGVVATPSANSSTFTADTAIADTWARPATATAHMMAPQMKSAGALANNIGDMTISTGGSVVLHLDQTSGTFNTGGTGGTNQPFVAMYYVGTGS